MDLHSIVQRFIQLDGAVVGRGPKHPTSPNLSIYQEVEAFVDRYPFLRIDQGYIDFLYTYAGAWVMSDDLDLDIFGFTEVSSHIIGLEGPVIDDDGYLTLCDGSYQLIDQAGVKTSVQLGCAFDATSTRKWGIYRNKGYKLGELDRYWYCKTFVEWFDALVEAKGKLPHSPS